MKKTIVLSLTLALSGCASMTTGQNQPISVDTKEDKGATCKLINDKGTWYINSTPGSVVVKRAYGDLSVDCQKGNKKGSEVVKSKTKGMTFGNVILGGGIGALVDCGTGSAYDYPETISVELK